MKLLPSLTIICIILIVTFETGECHTPLSIGRAVGRFIRRPLRTITRPFRTLARLPFRVISRIHTTKKLLASKAAFAAILVKKAIIAKPLLIAKTIAGSKLIKSRGRNNNNDNNNRNIWSSDGKNELNVPLEFKVKPITIKTYIHTRGDLNNRREQERNILKSSKSINQNTNRSQQQMQQLPRVTLV